MPQSHLPVQSTPFIGREHDVQRILSLVRQTSSCLITLVGMGGIGKTRLAIEVVKQFANQDTEHDGVLFVPLAPLSNHEHIGNAISEIINLKQSTTDASDDQLINYFKARRLLLILDNFEHIQDPQRQKDKLELVKKQVEHLNTIIEKLLTMAQLDSGVHFDSRQFDLVSLVRGIHAQIKPRADVHGAEFLLKVTDETLLVVADSSYLQDAIVQLLDNAFNYTPSDSIITLQCYKDKKEAVISVTDNGIGISRENLRYIFNRFYRVEPARSPTGRSGLGLAIARSIVTAHGGRCTVTSTIGEGSTFSIHLPLV